MGGGKPASGVKVHRVPASLRERHETPGLSLRLVQVDSKSRSRVSILPGFGSGMWYECMGMCPGPHGVPG